MQLIETKQCSKTQSKPIVLKSASKKGLIVQIIKNYLQMRKVDTQVDYVLVGSE